MSDLQMRALVLTTTEEGELFPGDLFFPGYFHVRESGIFDTSTPILWTNPRVRSHQLATEGLAEYLEEEVTQELPKKKRKKLEEAEVLADEPAPAEAEAQEEPKPEETSDVIVSEPSTEEQQNG